jgi:uncharacterized protein YdeI (YjbR/CyaY-like superfamily)
MSEPPLLRCADRAAWRDWLAQHHAQPGSVWLVIPRKGHGALTVSDAVDEALCFGWIDSRPRRLDDAASLLLMSPRRAGRAWSGVNKTRIARLRDEGRMAPAGEAAIARAEADGTWSLLDDASALREPPELLAALRAAPGALAAWRAFPPSHRRANLEWLAQAKRAETRAARIAEIATRAAKGQRANTWRRPP